ncbi:MAG: YceD family protein [Gammaproteobacteria bacterium]|nr:YceD family protein [Gammaproteobacteria bacterium]
MRDKLRRGYQVHKEVTRNGYFEGDIALSELARLGELLQPGESEQDERKIAVKFEFVRNEYDVPMITGQLQTSLELECQRCLKPLDMPLQLDFQLMIDADDDLLRDSSVDTIYSDDGFIDIFEVVEDELILATPLVALHEDTSCNEHWQASTLEPEAAKENPFAVLQQLKTTD